MAHRPRGGGPRREDDDGERGDRGRERCREHERPREERYDDPEEHHRVEKHRFAGGLPADAGTLRARPRAMESLTWRHREAVHGSGSRRGGSRAATAGADPSGQEGARTMSLNGTVWEPIGPSPIDQGAISANGQVTAIAVNPNNPNIIYIGTAWGGVWLTRDGGSHLDADLRSSAFARRRRSRRDRDRSGQHQHHLRRNQQPRRLAVLRRSDAAAGRAVQVDRRRRRVGSGSVSDIRRARRAMRASSSIRSSTSSSSIRPTPRRLSRVQRRPLRFHRWRLQLDQGRVPGGDVRSLSLDPTSPAAARILYAGVSGVGVVQSTDGGLNWNDDPQRRHPGGRRRPRRRRIRQSCRRTRAPCLSARSRRHPGALRHDGRNRNARRTPSASS